jgi:hypothetical protein
MHANMLADVQAPCPACYPHKCIGRCLMVLLFISHIAVVQAAAAASVANHLAVLSYAPQHSHKGIHKAIQSGMYDVVQDYVIHSNFDSSVIDARDHMYDCARCSLIVVLISCSIQGNPLPLLNLSNAGTLRCARCCCSPTRMSTQKTPGMIPTSALLIQTRQMFIVVM